MKLPLLSLSFVLGVATAAAEPSLPEFNSKTLDLPPLSLNDLMKAPTAKPFSFQAIEPSPPAAMRPPAPQRRVNRDSGMPVLEPDPRVDYRMIVKSPDPAIDFKMIVKPVEPPPAK